MPRIRQSFCFYLFGHPVSVKCPRLKWLGWDKNFRRKIIKFWFLYFIQHDMILLKLHKNKLNKVNYPCDLNSTCCFIYKKINCIQTKWSSLAHKSPIKCKCFSIWILGNNCCCILIFLLKSCNHIFLNSCTYTVVARKPE